MIRFRLRCSCVKAYTDPKYRWVNVSFKEGAEAPMIPCGNNEWANVQCPKCHGAGYTDEVATGQIDVAALRRDFDKKIAFRK